MRRLGPVCLARVAVATEAAAPVFAAAIAAPACAALPISHSANPSTLTPGTAGLTSVGFTDRFNRGGGGAPVAKDVAKNVAMS